MPSSMSGMRWLLWTIFFFAIPVILSHLVPGFLGKESWDELAYRCFLYLNGFLLFVLAIMAFTIASIWQVECPSPFPPSAPVEDILPQNEANFNAPPFIPIMGFQTPGQFETPVAELPSSPSSVIGSLSIRLQRARAKIEEWKRRYTKIHNHFRDYRKQASDTENSKKVEIKHLRDKLDMAELQVKASSLSKKQDIETLKERHEQEKSNAVKVLIKQRDEFESEAKIQAQLYSNSSWDRADVERFTKDACEKEHAAKLNEVREFYAQQLDEVAERTKNESSNQIQLLANAKEEKENELMAVKAEIVNLKEELTEAETEKRNHEEWKRMAGAEFWQLWRGCEKLERALKVSYDWTGSASLYRCEGVDGDGDYEMDSPGPDRNDTQTMSVLEMENMNMNLRRQLVEHESLTADLVKENKDLRGEIMKVEADASMNTKIADDEKHNLKSAMESLQSQNSKLATDHAHLDRELGQLRMAHKNANEADLIGRTDQIAAFQSEIARLNQAIESQNEERLRASASEASELRAQVYRLQSEKSEIEASKHTLEIVHSQVSAEKDAATAEVTRLMQEGNGLIASKTSVLQSEISRLQSELADITESKNYLNSVHSEVQAQKEAALLEVARLSQETNGPLASEGSELRSQVDRLQSKKSEIAASKEALEVTHRQITAEKDAALAEVARLMQEGSELLVKYNNLETESLHMNIPGLEAEKDKAVSEAERLRAEVNELQKKNSELEILRSAEAKGALECQDEALKEVTHLTELGNDLQNNYDQLKRDHQVVCDARDDALTGIQLLQAMGNDLQAKCDRLESEKLNAMDTNNVLSADDTAAAVSLLQASSKMLSDENRSLRDQNSGLKAEMMASTKTLSTKYNALQEENSLLKSQIMVAESDKASFKAKEEALQNQMTMIGKTDPELQRELRKAREKKEEADHKLKGCIYLADKLRLCARELNEQLNDINECAQQRDFPRLCLLLEYTVWQSMVNNCKSVWEASHSQFKLNKWDASPAASV